ncbi:ion channel [Nocardia arthritidis]|nr:ion channel [Nocardia arthritidis]
MTTVGYGDVYPVTTEGRLISLILMTLGIGLISFAIGTTTS